MHAHLQIHILYRHNIIHCIIRIGTHVRTPFSNLTVVDYAHEEGS